MGFKKPSTSTATPFIFFTFCVALEVFVHLYVACFCFFKQISQTASLFILAARPRQSLYRWNGAYTKMQASERGRIPSYPCAGRYIEYGHDKALHQRKGRSPSQLVFRKARLWDDERIKFGEMDREVVHKMFGDKNQKFAGPQMDRFLIALCTNQAHFFLPQRVPPPRRT